MIVSSDSENTLTHSGLDEIQRFLSLRLAWFQLFLIVHIKKLLNCPYFTFVDSL